MAKKADAVSIEINELSFEEALGKLESAAEEIKKSDIIETIVAEEKKAMLDEVEKAEEEEGEKEEPIPDNASIDDLLSMLSIGEDK